MDMDILVVMATVLFLALMASGVMLLFPISRRAAQLIEWHIQAKKDTATPAADELHRIRTELAALEEQVAGVADRQAFLERLLEERRSKEPVPSAGTDRD